MGAYDERHSCPRCNKKDSVIAYGDTRFFWQLNGECLNCGWHFGVTEEQYDLKLLNELRKENGMKPIKKLPKINTQDYY